MNYYICESCGQKYLGRAETVICEKCGGKLKKITGEEFDEKEEAVIEEEV